MPSLVYIYPGVAAAERFLEEPQDGSVAKGANALLRCTVEHRVGAVQWLRNGFGLGLGPTLVGYPRYRVLANPDFGERGGLIQCSHSAAKK